MFAHLSSARRLATFALALLSFSACVDGPADAPRPDGRIPDARAPDGAPSACGFARCGGDDIVGTWGFVNSCDESTGGPVTSSRQPWDACPQVSLRTTRALVGTFTFAADGEFLPDAHALALFSLTMPTSCATAVLGRLDCDAVATTVRALLPPADKLGFGCAPAVDGCACSGLAVDRLAAPGTYALADGEVTTRDRTLASDPTGSHETTRAYCVTGDQLMLGQALDGGVEVHTLQRR